MPRRRMLCRSFFSSSFHPPEFAKHVLCSLNVFRLCRLPTADEQDVNGRPGSRVINPIASASMNSHFVNAFAHGFRIAEVSVRCATQAGQNSRLCFLVSQIGKPCVEIGGPDEGIHAPLVYPSGYHSAIPEMPHTIDVRL